ncbi:MAG TPA: carboxypeptidase-like regulatory domain-containing protein [Candidatus Brocadiales bacterium]|nr:carboxypeptidase-like regulatory domain-containing protein [Candidatus Brocadiales bacterium]
MPRFHTISPLPDGPTPFVGATLGAEPQCYSPGAPPPGLRVCPEPERFRVYPTTCPTKAFTLLEIVAVIAIIGILGGTIAPLAVQLFTSKRGEVTVDRLEEFKKAIIGNPFVIGDDVRSSFGYIGDMGNLPANLQDLYIRGAQLPWPPIYDPVTQTGYDPDRKTGAGWRGPYINPAIIEDLATLRLDAYMQQFVYSTTGLAPGDTPVGVLPVGRLFSTGPNRTQGGGVADDRNVYIFQSETFSTVSGFLKDAAGNGVPGITVKMNYPTNGVLSATPPVAVTTSTGYFSFSNVPYGNRSITVEPKLVYASGSARAGDFGERSGPPCSFVPDSDGIHDDIELYITNLSPNTITVVAVKVYFDVSGNPNPNLTDMTLGGKCGQVLSGGTTGDVVRFTGSDTVTINGSGITGGQCYLVRVQSPQTHLPDLRINNYPAGTTAKMQIMDFKSGSRKLNVSGIPFKAEFYSTWTGGAAGSGTLISTIYFTPNVN